MSTGYVGLLTLMPLSVIRHGNYPSILQKSGSLSQL